LYFSKTLTDRSSGLGRKEKTLQSHIVAIKFWMCQGFSKDAVMALETLGAKDGPVDGHLKAAK